MSCSDITGTSGGGSAAKDCRSGHSLLAAARAVRSRNPAAAAETYQQAAEAYRRAGDAALANQILAEAQSLAAATPPAGQDAAPPASAPPAAAPNAVAATSPPVVPSAPGPHWKGTSDPADCANANFVEHSSAYWGFMCVHWQGTSNPKDCLKADADERKSDEYYEKCRDVAPPRSVAGYRPYPDPQALSLQVREICKSWSRDTRQCYIDNKLKVILDKNPAIRAACADRQGAGGLREQLAAKLGGTAVDPNDTPFNRCVDEAYLYGLERPPQPNDRLRQQLQKRLSERGSGAGAQAGGDDDQAPAAKRPPRDQLPQGICPSGQGLKPVAAREGGFGAWACAPLDAIIVATDKPQGDAADGPAAPSAQVDHFEQRARDVAVRIAEAVASARAAAVPAADRDACIAAAADAVLSEMKGGATPAPPACAALVEAARSELAYNAKWGIDPFDPGVAELFSYLAQRNPATGGSLGGNLGPPLMTGLEPSAEDRRFADCIVAGGTRDNCAAEAAKVTRDARGSPQRGAASGQAADCASAETHWKSAEEIRTIEAYEDHLRRFPGCPFATLARARLEALSRK